MHERFSRGEYWLLESVITSPIPLPWLVDPDLEAALNKQSHGLSADEVTESLFSLVFDGLIQVSHAGTSEPFSPTRPQITEGMSQVERKKYWHYMLTPAGGAAWEAFAAPTWNTYVNAYSVSSSDETLIGTVETAEPSLAVSYLAGLHYVGVILNYQSIIVRDLAPWKSTYWKTLPSGFRIRYTYSEDRRIPDWGSVPSSYADIYSSRWYRWQTGM